MARSKIHGIEKRSRHYYHTGFAFSCAIIAMFVMAFIAVFIATEFWKSWVYAGTINLSESCVYRGYAPDVAERPPFSPITLPHRPLVTEPPQGEKVILEYACKLPSVKANTLAYAHWGWFSAEKATVSVGGKVIASFSGIQKIIMPIQGGEHVTFLAEQSAAKADSAGFIGVQKPVIALGLKANNNLFGIEVLLTITRSLSYLVPILSLGVVLGFAWFGGFRSRKFLMALYVMILASLHRASALLPAIFDVSEAALTVPMLMLRIGFGFSLVLFHMEVTRVLAKKIYPLARITAVALVVLAVIVMSSGSLELRTNAFIAGHFAVGIASLGLASALVRRRSAQDLVILAVSAIAGLLYLHDGIARLSGNLIYYSNQLQIILPMYVAIFLLVTMSISDRKYHRQRQRSEKLAELVDLEAAKASTLSRFLPQSLVARFTTKRSIEENLSQVLSPRVADIALIQADLRGFSSLVHTMEETEVVRILNLCFGPVVDHAQKFSMVKLVGDCLFAFIEKGVDKKTETDLAIEIAAHLIDRTNWMNEQVLGRDLLRFGIAIHYGRAIVGNLSSDQCIDYTVIGEAANLTARLEELTKSPQISARIGKNGIILSEAAAERLHWYVAAHDEPLHLDGIRVRSFENVRSVRYMTEEQCLLAVFGQSEAATEEPILRMSA